MNTTRSASTPKKVTKSLFVDTLDITDNDTSNGTKTSRNSKQPVANSNKSSNSIASNSVTQTRAITIPKYDGTMSITKYLKLVDQFTIEIKKERYNLLLAFVNDWLKLEEDDVKLISLSDFKNMEESVILKDKKHNMEILRRYKDEIVQKLNPNFDIDEETDSDDIKDKYIIYFMSKSLTAIDFAMVSKTYGKRVLYTIKMK